MPKQSLAQKSVYWLKVISLGLILGIGIQFALAWTPPTIAPPGGNVSGPLTTSNVSQYKTGRLGVNSNSAPTYAFEVGGGGSAAIGGAVYVGGAVHAMAPGWSVIADDSIFASKNINAGWYISAPWICINGDCKNAWPSGGGGVADNLGNHIATTTLNMNGNIISNVSTLNVTSICLSGDCKSAWPTGGGGIASIKSGSCGVGQVVKSITEDGTVTCGNVVSGNTCGLFTDTMWSGVQTQTIFPCAGITNSRTGGLKHDCPPGYSFKYLPFSTREDNWGGVVIFPDTAVWSCVGQ